MSYVFSRCSVYHCLIGKNISYLVPGTIFYIASFLISFTVIVCHFNLQNTQIQLHAIYILSLGQSLQKIENNIFAKDMTTHGPTSNTSQFAIIIPPHSVKSSLVALHCKNGTHFGHI